jgi:tRNA modification GTPase
MERLAATHARGRLIADGLEVALVGRANAGKSSLLNALAGEERALVDAAPGTTRDYLELEVDLDGVRVRLVDMAGERLVTEEVERRGLELGRQRRRRADLILLVVDGTVGFGEVEARLLAEVGDGVSVLLAWNKADLQPEVNGVPPGVQAVATSAVLGTGLTALGAAIGRATGDAGDDEVLLTSARQREALDEAVGGLRAGARLLADGQPPELAAVDLRVALDRLGRVSGDSVDEAVLDVIFARFCIGK